MGTHSGGNDDHSAQLAIALFECRLAVEMAAMAARTLARRRCASDVKAQIEELVGLLDQCGDSFEKFAIQLNDLFNVRGQERH